MKKVFSLLFIVSLFTCSFVIKADEAAINMQYKGNQHTHLEHFVPVDMPEVFYDSDTQEIIIEADGFASYYIVEIISMATSQSMVYTQIGGYGDNIDVSSFPPGYYQIEITSSNNNEYEGYFTVE